jgi:alpha-tubulin suppressor-like RCC1 family protein
VTTDWPWPASISSLTSGVTVISGGVEHSCAVASGGAKCWGTNTYWELGDGTTDQSLVPIDVLTLQTGVYSITAGERHSCAILDTGILKCWGDNTYGALGDGSTTSSSTPVTVVFP